MPRIKQLPPRSKVKPSDTWDLSSLFASNDDWEAAFNAWEGRIGDYARFQGKLAESPESLAGCLQFDLDLDRAAERLGNFAFLKTAEDVGESQYQRMHGRFQAVASRAAGRQLHPPGDPGHSRGQDESDARFAAVGPL